MRISDWSSDVCSSDLVGVALSPEYAYQIQPGAAFPDFKRFGVLWVGRRALEAALDMDGAFNEVVLRLQPGADARAVIAELDLRLRSDEHTSELQSLMRISFAVFCVKYNTSINSCTTCYHSY